MNKFVKEVNKEKKDENIKRIGNFVFFLTSYHAFIRLKSIKPCDTKLLTVDEDKYNKR
jgi:hypothetical protein